MINILELCISNHFYSAHFNCSCIYEYMDMWHIFYALYLQNSGFKMRNDVIYGVAGFASMQMGA